MSSSLPRSICSGLGMGLLVAALLAGCGGGDKTFDGDGYSFTYPGDWEEREGGGFAAQVGNRVSSVAFAPASGASGLTVTVYDLQIPVTTSNIDAIAPEVSAVNDQIFRQAGGRVTEAPTRVTVAGHPGFSAKGLAVTPQGVRVQSQITMLFDGKTEYFLNCQLTPDQAEEMTAGCRKAVDTFELK
jgi:hypothetical protein